jgi:hypothetical protein
MHSLFGLPVWAVALVVAAFAPFCARAWGTVVERRVRERSVRLLASLGRVGSNVQSERPTTKDRQGQS